MGVFYGQVSQNDNSSVKRRGFTDESRNRWSSYPFCNKSFQEECQEVWECIELAVESDILVPQLDAVFYIWILVFFQQIV